MSSKRFAGEVIWGSCALGFNETCFGFCVFARVAWTSQQHPAKTRSRWSTHFCKEKDSLPSLRNKLKSLELEHEAFLCQSFDFFLFSWLLKHTKQVSKQVPHFSNVKKAFSPKVLELGQLRYHVKTTHERCGPFSLVVLSQRRGRVNHIKWLPSKTLKHSPADFS